MWIETECVTRKTARPARQACWSCRHGAESATNQQARDLDNEAGKLKDSQRALDEAVARSEAEARQKALAGSATALLAAQLLRAEALKDGTHKWQLEQGYEMGRPSDLFLEADVADGALKAVRVAGQAVKVTQGTLEI